MASTIFDVARLSGFSKTTVSRAFVNPDKVNEETKKIIYEAAKSLNYSPNAIARAMVKQKNENIAFIIYEKHFPISLNPFYSSIFESVQLELEHYGYNLYIVSNGDVAPSNRELFLKKRVDGVIIAGQTSYNVIANFRAQNVPVVLVNNKIDLEDLVCVGSDDYGGTVQAMEHLISKGHRKIGLISGRLLPYISSIRYSAYMEVMARHGLPIDDRFIRTIEPRQEEAIACAREMLLQDDRPTALFCNNDTIGVGAIKAALRLGLKVPEDVAVIGYDDNAICTVVEPELSSISVNTAEMGRLSAQSIVSLINGEKPKQQHIQLRTRLVARQST